MQRAESERREATRPPGSAAAARVAVVGAGIAGLAASHRLRGAGAGVTLFDKGRAAGGRMATRRSPSGLVVDHGAQYFTARDPEFVTEVSAWERAGVVARWEGRIATLSPGSAPVPVTPGEPLWIGRERNSAVPRHLAAGLEVRVGERVESLDEGNAGWRLVVEGGRVAGPFDALLLAVPAPQAAALLPPGDPLGRAAAQSPMRPTWALLLQTAGEDRLPFDGAFANGSPVAWWKRGRSPGAWVAHASHDWSEAWLEARPEEVVAELLPALEALAGGPGRFPVAEATAHRWRYAAPGDAPPPAAGCLADGSRRLALGGDWCRGGRVEGAWLSGLAAARELGAALGLEEKR